MITPGGRPDGKMEDAARLAAERTRRFHDDPEPSLASRLGQIGILGWTIVVPILLGVVTRPLARPDLRRPAIFFTAPLSWSARRSASGRPGDGCTGR